MKRLAIAVAATLAVISLSACTQETPPPVTVTVTASPVPVPQAPVAPVEPLQPQVNAEDEFLFDVRTYIDVPVSQEQNYIDLGNAVCDALDQGAGKAEIVQVIVDEGISEDDAIVVVAAAVVNFCPAYSEGGQSA